LLEPQRTNLFRFSEQFDQSFWIKSNTTVTPNTTISPDGYQNADTMTTVAGTSRIIDDTVYGAGTYTASLYVKRLTGDDDFQFRFVVDGSNQGQDFTVTSEWQRFTFTVTAASQLRDLQLRSAAAGTGTFAIWGAQLEAGAYATSYIPTLGSAVTRNSDAASKTGASSFIGQQEGTLFAEFNARSLSETRRVFYTYQDGNNFIMLTLQSTNDLRFLVFAGGAIQANFTTPIVNGNVKMAGAYKANDFVFYVNGVQIGTDASGTVPATSEIHVGYDIGGTLQLADGISQALLFKTRLSNADLARLTSI
jgi:hypothetical protein